MRVFARGLVATAFAAVTTLSIALVFVTARPAASGVTGTVAQTAQSPAGRGQTGGGRGRGDNDPWPGLKKLLAVADVQSGLHHDSISHAPATV